MIYQSNFGCSIQIEFSSNKLTSWCSDFSGFVAIFKRVFDDLDRWTIGSKSSHFTFLMVAQYYVIFILCINTNSIFIYKLFLIHSNKYLKLFAIVTRRFRIFNLKSSLFLRYQDLLTPVYSVSSTAHLLSIVQISLLFFILRSSRASRHMITVRCNQWVLAARGCANAI